MRDQLLRLRNPVCDFYASLSLWGRLCQTQRADGDGIRAKGGEADERSGCEGFHRETLERGGNAGAQGVAQARQPAAENDHLRMEEVDDVGETEREVFAYFTNQLLGEWVLLGERGGQVAGFIARIACDHLRKWTDGVFQGQFADAGIHGPPGTARFHGCSIAIQTDVTDFSLTRSGAVVNPAIQYQATAYAAAEGNIEHRTRANAGSVEGFAVRGHVAIVVHSHGSVGQRLQPGTERECRPAGNLVRTTNFPRAPIHRSTKADARGGDDMGAPKLGDGVLNLFANARRAASGINRQPAAFRDVPVGVAKDELQFRAANFNAQDIHAGGELTESGMGVHPVLGCRMVGLFFRPCRDLAFPGVTH